jgi:hypothetical protein
VSRPDASYPFECSRHDQQDSTESNQSPDSGFYRRDARFSISLLHGHVELRNGLKYVGKSGLDLISNIAEIGLDIGDVLLNVCDVGFELRSTDTIVVSPGITMSTPSANISTPVTSVVRKKNCGW